MQHKFRLDEKTWKEFLQLTSTPAQTIRDLIVNYIKSHKKEGK